MQGGERPGPLSQPMRSSLIVDDDSGIRAALAFVLKRLGLEIAEAGSLAALDEALSRGKPDIVFLDLNLGGPGGAGGLGMLAARGYDGCVQIMSGKSRPQLDGAVALGEDYGLRMLPPLAKPFRMAAVREIVSSL